jgi:hypothetical protein
MDEKKVTLIYSHGLRSYRAILDESKALETLNGLAAKWDAMFENEGDGYRTESLKRNRSKGKIKRVAVELVYYSSDKPARYPYPKKLELRIEAAPKDAPEIIGGIGIGYAYDLSRFNGSLKGIIEKSIDVPGITLSYTWSENQYTYTDTATYDAETRKVWLTGFHECPGYVSHHVGSCCSVCGQDER